MFRMLLFAGIVANVFGSFPPSLHLKKSVSPPGLFDSEESQHAMQHSNFKSVPSSILDKLRKVSSVNDFMKEFRPQGVYKQKKSSTEIFNKQKAFSLKEPKDLSCKPRAKIVPVIADHSHLLWPSCVELYQCGGCCFNSDHFECVPSEVRNRTETVFKIPLYGNESPAPHVVELVDHSACRCQCRVRPSDCLPTQTYDPHNCQCECRRKPEPCPYGKQWSLRYCQCVCSHVHPCPKRFIFDRNRCTCQCKRKKCHHPLTLDPSTCRCVYMAGHNQFFGGSRQGIGGKSPKNFMG